MAVTPAVPMRSLRMPGGLWFLHEVVPPAADGRDGAGGDREAKESKKTIEPRLTGTARELRDQWVEQADALPAVPAKHDMRRLIAPNRPALDPINTRTALPEAA